MGAGDMGQLVTSEHVCAGGEYGKDTCEIDIGGAAWYLDERMSSRATIYAVTNAGGEVCDGTVPGVFTRITHHLVWLNGVTGGAVGSGVTGKLVLEV